MTHDDRPIYVTRPDLPPLQELLPSLEAIWQNRNLTNCGPFHEQLEVALCEYLGVEHLSLVTNATVGLLLALRAVKVCGEVITTPFTFAATSHGLVWSGLTPVFVDVEPGSLNIDPARIEAAITPQTCAILAVHCYGFPCQVEAIDAIAKRHGLKVIYDAAHAFGVRHEGQSLLAHGDLSVLSFHATKVFNTFEGGAVVARDAEMKAQIDLLKNFGISDEVTIDETGINGKMSEFNAALGLLQLKRVDEAIEQRCHIADTYLSALKSVRGIRCLARVDEPGANYAYFPILIEDGFGCTRDEIHFRMKANHVNARRYFFPLVSSLPPYRRLASAAPENLPVATQAADRVLCLPIYPGLSPADQTRVIEALLQA